MSTTLYVTHTLYVFSRKMYTTTPILYSALACKVFLKVNYSISTSSKDVGETL